jgi:hypothetical protein
LIEIAGQKPGAISSFVISVEMTNEFATKTVAFAACEINAVDLRALGPLQEQRTDARDCPVTSCGDTREVRREIFAQGMKSDVKREGVTDRTACCVAQTIRWQRPVS